MIALVPPPHLSSQMSWGQAVPYFLLLPISIVVFRSFMIEGMSRLLPGAGMGTKVLKLGFVLATGILGVGVVGSGYAVVRLLNYTLIDDSGIRRVQFRRPDQYQVWKDYESAQEVTKTKIESAHSTLGDRMAGTDGVALHFKEGGRWKVTLYVWSEEFPAKDYSAFVTWLKSGRTF